MEYSLTEFANKGLHLLFQELVLLVDGLTDVLTLKAVDHLRKLFSKFQAHHLRLRDADILTIVASGH